MEKKLCKTFKDGGKSPCFVPLLLLNVSLVRRSIQSAPCSATVWLLPQSADLCNKRATQSTFSCEEQMARALDERP